MPAKEFICPNGDKVSIGECLAKCPQGERCMFLPTLRAIAEGLDRGLTEPTVTELLAGTRETYLKKTTDYAVSPMDQVFALHGSSMHAMQENRVSAACFAATTGYGYDDLGREKLERVYADTFHTEAALVRPQITCGTHALTVALSANLLPEDGRN